MKEAVYAAEVHKGAVVGDVAHLALADDTLFEALERLFPALGALLLDQFAVREDDLLLLAVGLQHLEAKTAADEALEVAEVARADV